ncbi:MAG: SurA N-terminal domain-containing protein [Bacteroidales bacterium]|nr:SurA N-terminal domain-containing protein [Bacteroidales bacterium]MBR5093232.1 SurA N-terminal domain-containing protein [Bacteroidales bacterium]
MAIIGSIRKHSWIAVVLVGGAILAFIFQDLSKNRSSIPDMGKVNATTMTSQRFNELVTEMENNYKMQQQTTQIPSDVENQIREMVWEQFVDETLMEEQTTKLGLTVSAAELSDMYTGMFIHPAVRQSFTDPQTGRFDLQQVNYWIDNFDNLDTMRRMQWVELEKNVRRDREQQKYNSLISNGFYMPKAINEKIASYAAETSNVRVAALPYSSVADEEAAINDDDFKAYYDEHRAEFRVQEEMRELEFITFPVNPTPEDLNDIENDVKKVWEEFQTVPEDEIAFFVNAESDRSYDSSYMKATSFKAPFDEQIAAASAGSFLAPVMAGGEWMMAKVLSSAVRPDSLRASVVYILNSNAGGGITRSDDQAKHLADSVLALVNGNKMSFEQAVQQFSDDPQKGETMGDMNWQLDGGYGFLNEQIVNTPVGHSFLFTHPMGVGYFVVKVTDKTPANKKYRVALITREIVPSNNTNRAIYSEANRFAGQNRSIDAFDAAAREQNLQVRSARVNMMSDNMAGVPNARSIVQWAYNEDTKVGAVADQVYECDGMFVVVALKDVYKKGIATLDQMRPMIEQQVRLDKKAQVLMERANAAVKAGQDINSVAVALNVTVDTLEGVSFNDYNLQQFGMEPKVLAAVAATQSGLVGPVKGANGVYVVQVDGKVAREANVNEMNRMEQGLTIKSRYVSQVLRSIAKITDQRNKFF